EPGPRELEHLGRLDVGEGPEHLLQLGEVCEAGKAAAGLERFAVRRYLHRLHHLAERGRPGVKMLDAALGKPPGVEVTLDRVELDHGVADGRAGRNVTPWPGCRSWRLRHFMKRSKARSLLVV